MRNKEILLYSAVALSLTAAGTLTGGLAAGLPGAIVCGVFCTLLCLWGLLFTRWRYRQILLLSAQVNAAIQGGPVLPLRTNREGELSILRNDLYKVLSAYAGQSEQLRRDKTHLSVALSDISHQIKTPLTGLLVMCDALQSDALPEEKRKNFVHRIETQLERLRWLVDSLLRLSRLDAGVVPFQKKQLVLHTVISRAAQPILPLAEQRGVAIQVECPRSLVWVGDAEWTAEAVCNLLKNAVEHTPPGKTVYVNCRQTPLHTSLQIQDEGPGFAEEDLPRLFERFYRGSSAHTQSEGVGIGLALAKSILMAQGAQLTAQNAPPKGACFTICLHTRAK
ncbi:MAG: sensor histidine kinase [Oscillospiraceae bacterium]